MRPDDRLYQAERAVDIMGYPIRLADEDAAFDYLNCVLNTQWFYNRWPKLATDGVSIKGTKHSYAYGWIENKENKILIPTWALTDFGILHELAHLIEHKEREDMHDAVYRKTYLDLVKQFMGKPAGECLYYAMRAYGLDIK